MVDLQTQYFKIKTELDNAVYNVLESAQFINGPEVKSFQKELEEYLGVKHVIPCANGTDALQAALMALDLHEGDEIITADFTFAATVEVIHLLKLKAVLVDVDPETFTISPEEIEKAISPKTKAIIPVHLFGQCADLESILAIAKKHNLFIIEDNAQAIGAQYSMENPASSSSYAGSFGHLGTTSFFPSKNLGCYGDGGAIFTQDDDLAKKLRAIVNHGMYERYYHEEVGINSRLDSLQAAILRKKLPFLSQYNEARSKVATQYDEAFKVLDGIIIPKKNPKSSHVFHQYTIRVLHGKRDALKEHLEALDIPAMVYYPVPLRKQKAYFQDIKDRSFANTDMLCNEVLSLPMHTELDDTQIQYIISSIQSFFKI